MKKIKILLINKVIIYILKLELEQERNKRKSSYTKNLNFDQKTPISSYKKEKTYPGPELGMKNNQSPKPHIQTPKLLYDTEITPKNIVSESSPFSQKFQRPDDRSAYDRDSVWGHRMEIDSHIRTYNILMEDTQTAKMTDDDYAWDISREPLSISGVSPQPNKLYQNQGSIESNDICLPHELSDASFVKNLDSKKIVEAGGFMSGQTSAKNKSGVKLFKTVNSNLPSTKNKDKEEVTLFGNIENLPSLGNLDENETFGAMLTKKNHYSSPKIGDPNDYNQEASIKKYKKSKKQGIIKNKKIESPRNFEEMSSRYNGSHSARPNKNIIIPGEDLDENREFIQATPELKKSGVQSPHFGEIDVYTLDNRESLEGSKLSKMSRLVPPSPADIQLGKKMVLVEKSASSETGGNNFTFKGRSDTDLNIGNTITLPRNSDGRDYSLRIQSLTESARLREGKVFYAEGNQYSIFERRSSARNMSSKRFQEKQRYAMLRWAQHDNENICPRMTGKKNFYLVRIEKGKSLDCKRNFSKKKKKPRIFFEKEIINRRAEFQNCRQILDIYERGKLWSKLKNDYSIKLRRELNKENEFKEREDLKEIRAFFQPCQTGFSYKGVGRGSARRFSRSKRNISQRSVRTEVC